MCFNIWVKSPVMIKETNKKTLEKKTASIYFLELFKIFILLIIKQKVINKTDIIKYHKESPNSVIPIKNFFI